MIIPLINLTSINLARVGVVLNLVLCEGYLGSIPRLSCRGYNYIHL